LIEFQIRQIRIQKKEPGKKLTMRQYC
jgi:hypothetical protein